jgi:uncharacterized protein DUF3558
VKRRFAAVPVFAAVLSLAACSGIPASSQGPGQAGGSTPASPGGTASSSEESPLASIKACNLISRSVAAQMHMQLDGPGSNFPPTKDDCSWTKPVDASGLHGYTAGVTLRPTQGTKDVNTRGWPTITNYSTAGHHAKRLRAPNGNCLIAIGVTNSSRVDVTVNAELDSALACKVADQMAQVIARELPSI